MKTLLNIEWQPKDPIVYDDAYLKRIVCRHLPEDLRTFINHEGIEEKYCSACKTFESDMEVKHGR